MKPRLFRLLVIACIAAVSLGSALLISAGGATETQVAHQSKGAF